MPIDPLSAVGFGVGGLAEILKSLGVFKSPEQQSKEAARKYIEGNMPEFNYQPQAFDASKYQDVLGPMAERQGTYREALGNKLGMQGLGRSGYGNEMVMATERQQGQDMDKTMTGLARTEEEKAYRRALEKYRADMDKTSMMAQLQ